MLLKEIVSVRRAEKQANYSAPDLHSLNRTRMIP